MHVHDTARSVDASVCGSSRKSARLELTAGCAEVFAGAPGPLDGAPLGISPALAGHGSIFEIELESFHS